MRTLRAALLAAAALSAACVWRRAADAGPDATAEAGVPMAFGDPRRDTHLQWDFGDGETAEGAAVRHAWSRSGRYTVVATAPDGAGDEAHVTVEARPAAAAVPSWARAALVAPRPWARARAAEALARRLFGAEEAHDLVEQVRERLRFDPRSPLEVAGAGFDPEEGVAAFTAPGDEDAVFVAAGVWDAGRAEATVLAALGRTLDGLAIEERAFGGARVVVARGWRPAGEGAEAERAAIGLAFSYGYLYLLAAPDDDGELASRLARVLEQAPDAGLGADPRRRTALQRVSPADVVLYLAPALVAESDLASLADAPEEIGAAVAGLAIADDGVRVDARGLLELSAAEASRARARWQASSPAPALAARVRPDATACARLSLEPSRLGRAASVLGEDLGEEFRRALVPALTGHAAVGAYLDGPELVRALRDGGVPPLDAGALVAVAEVKDGASAERALADLVERRRADLRVDVFRGPEGPFYEVAPPRGPSLAWAVRGRLLGVALGSTAGDRLRAVLEDAAAPASPSPAAPAGPALLVDANDRQSAFIDVAQLVAPVRGVSDSLGEPPLSGWTAFLTPIASIALDLRATDAGIEAAAAVRLR